MARSAALSAGSILARASLCYAQRPEVQVPEQQSALSRQPRPEARHAQLPLTQSM
jgi:hypothetical protein